MKVTVHYPHDSLIPETWIRAGDGWHMFLLNEILIKFPPDAFRDYLDFCESQGCTIIKEDGVLIYGKQQR